MDRKTIADATADTGAGLVERLVRIAGRGPEIPDDEIAAVKAVIRPEWEHLVRARRRHRQLAWGAGLAAAAVLVLAVLLAPPVQTPPEPLTVATISRIVGVASLIAEGGGTSAISVQDSGLAIGAGSLIRTGTGCRLALQLSPGRELRVDQATAVRLSGYDTMYLVQGGIYVDSGRDSGSDASRGLEVESAFGTATEIGTQFEARSEGALIIRVRDGAVRFHRDGDSMSVPAGFQARVNARGTVVTGVIRPDDPVWAWTQEVAAPFAIDGQTAAGFLDWVSRETGLHVRYEDQQARQRAVKTTLQGSLDGLSPQEAPALILPSCGLESRREGSSLVVSMLGS